MFKSLKFPSKHQIRHQSKSENNKKKSHQNENAAHYSYTLYNKQNPGYPFSPHYRCKRLAPFWTFSSAVVKWRETPEVFNLYFTVLFIKSGRKEKPFPMNRGKNIQTTDLNTKDTINQQTSSHNGRKKTELTALLVSFYVCTKKKINSNKTGSSPNIQ